jgi:surface protein
MSYLFSEMDDFNEPLDEWNVSNVENMEYMFAGCFDFNQPLNNWKVNKVKNMECMFIDCDRFDQPLNSWNVSNVTNMTEMFLSAGNFRQDISNWTLNPNVITTDIFKNTIMPQNFKPPNSEPNYKNMITDDIIANHSTSYRDHIDEYYRIYENKNFQLTICDAVALYLEYFDYYINGFLRGNPQLNTFKNQKLLLFFNKIINVLDDYFLTKAPRITAEMVKYKQNFVYRGEKGTKKIIRDGIIPAFTSTAPEIDIAMDFTNRNNCCLYIYKLSEGMPYIDVEDIMSNTNKYCGIEPIDTHGVNLIEFLLPRGINVSTKTIERIEHWDFGNSKNKLQEIKSYEKNVTYNPNYIRSNPVNLIQMLSTSDSNDKEPPTKIRRISAM